MRQSHGHDQADEQQFIGDASWFAFSFERHIPNPAEAERRPRWLIFQGSFPGSIIPGWFAA